MRRIAAAVIDGFTEALSSMFLFAMFAVVIFGIYARLAMERPPFWTEEMARYCMFYMVMLGCAIAIRKDSHPAITFLTDWIRGAWRFALEMWVEAVVLAAVLFMFVGGWEMMAGMAGRGRTASLRVRFSWIYLSIPLGCLLMGMAVIRRIAAEIVRTEPLDEKPPRFDA